MELCYDNPRELITVTEDANVGSSWGWFMGRCGIHHCLKNISTVYSYAKIPSFEKKKKFPFPFLVFYRRKLRSYLELYINCTEKCLLNKASFMSALKCKTHMTSELRSLLVLWGLLGTQIKYIHVLNTHTFTLIYM